MKTSMTLCLLAALLASSAPAQTDTRTNTTNRAQQQQRRRGGGGPQWPAATNTICWTGYSTNAQGETVAKIMVDVTDAPDLEDWGKHAGEICVDWYPKIAVMLGVDGDLHKTKAIKLWFHEMSGVANTSPPEGVIRISSQYVKAHTNDWGMVVHELVHTVQSFGGGAGRISAGGTNASPPSFSADDIKDVAAFAGKLKAHSDPVSRSIWDQLSDSARDDVSAATEANADTKALKASVARQINEIIEGGSILGGLRREEVKVAGVTLSRQSKFLLGQGLEGDQLARFNRSFLMDAYPDELGSGRNGNPGSWLTEGIADFVRYAGYEPETRPPRIDPDKAKYTDSYKTTAAFLRWIAKNYDKEFVKKINLALRDGKYNVNLFKDYTGKSIDDLWKEFSDSLRTKPKDV
jgi:hypothetical protein